jgi:hypothetical protein
LRTRASAHPRFLTKTEIKNQRTKADSSYVRASQKKCLHRLPWARLYLQDDDVFEMRLNSTMLLPAGFQLIPPAGV